MAAVAPVGTSIRLVVGLGNPGPQYQRTRHNAGADFVAVLAAHWGVALKAESRFAGDTARVAIAGSDVRLLIPATFMNLSGRAVGAMAGFYGIEAAAILVAHDEIDLPPGQARLKLGGGHGGHNGLRDIIRALANDAGFARLRLGVGHPGHASEVVEYVLWRAPAAEQELLAVSIEAALAVMPLAVAGDWNRAMKTLHTQTASAPDAGN